MSAGGYFQLYTVSSQPEEAFLLNEGQVFFFVSDADKYAIRGNNLILGATELILNKLLGMRTGRIETAVADAGVKIKKIPAEKFIASMNTYSVSINASMVIAKQVTLTNNIINKSLGGMESDERKNKDSAIEYFRIVFRLRKEYEKRKYPWLNDLVNRFEPSLLYKRGEALDRTAEPTRISSPMELSENTLEFQKDALICEEGSHAEDMFILQSGSIDVFIGGNKVASISDPGYVFGEIALLLGEKRTATLKAKNNVVLTRLGKADLKGLTSKHGEILTAIATSLAKKHYYNTEKIAAINTMLLEKKLASEEGGEAHRGADAHRSSTELFTLKKEVGAACRARKADFLDDLVDGF